MVEDVDVSFRRQDFHHKAEFDKVEQKTDEEHEDDGNVRCNGKHHCWLRLRRTLSGAFLFSRYIFRRGQNDFSPSFVMT